MAGLGLEKHTIFAKALAAANKAKKNILFSTCLPTFVMGRFGVFKTYYSGFLVSVKKTATLLLVLALLLQTFNRVGIYVSFRLNQDFIAKNLCENRTRPQLNCNGKCFLAKKLKAAEEQEKKTTPPGKFMESVLFCEPIGFFSLLPQSDLRSGILPAYPQAAYSSSLPDVFHPPQA